MQSDTHHLEDDEEIPNPYTDAMTVILKAVVSHREFFRQAPKALAYWMKWYDDLHYASRYDEDERLHDWVNLKYAIIDLKDEVGDEYSEFVYDAWGAGIHWRDDEGRPFHPLEAEPEKTMDQWLSMCLDPDYRFKMIYPDRRSVLEYVLCCYGTGLAWNKLGFIQDRDNAERYFGFWHCYEELPADLRFLVDAWKQNPAISKGFAEWERLKREELEEKRRTREAMEALNKEFEEMMEKKEPGYKANKAERMAELMRGSKPRLVYPMCKYSPLTHMPKNAHPSYVAAAREVCQWILAEEPSPNQQDNVAIAKAFLKEWGEC